MHLPADGGVCGGRRVRTKPSHCLGRGLGEGAIAKCAVKMNGGPLAILQYPASARLAQLPWQDHKRLIYVRPRDFRSVFTLLTDQARIHHTGRALCRGGGDRCDDPRTAAATLAWDRTLSFFCGSPDLSRETLETFFHSQGSGWNYSSPASSSTLRATRKHSNPIGTPQ